MRAQVQGLGCWRDCSAHQGISLNIVGLGLGKSKTRHQAPGRGREVGAENCLVTPFLCQALSS